MDGRNIGVVLMEQIIKGLDEIFCNVIIAVNKGDVRTGCRIQSHIPGIGLAAVFLMDDPDACVPLCPCITECRAVIGRTIIDQDHLKVRICLGQNAGDTPVQIGLYFIYRNNDGHEFVICILHDILLQAGLIISWEQGFRNENFISFGFKSWRPSERHPTPFDIPMRWDPQAK